MVNTNYANAYKEVLIVINNLVKEDYEKIPKEYIEFLEMNCNNDYDFLYNTSKKFEEQDLLEETKYILFGLFEKFSATEIQKEKIKFLKKNYNNKLEEEKYEKYNPENIFNNNQNNFNQKILEEKKTLIEYRKQNWYQKLFEKILKHLKEIFN